MQQQQQLTLRRVRFSKEADSWLKVMKSRTGVTPNLLCRLALCLSLNEMGAVDGAKYPEDSDREINRYTLLGEFDAAFVALLRQRLAGEPPRVAKDMDGYFRAHLHRGITLLATRLKTLGDIHLLVPTEAGVTDQRRRSKPTRSKHPRQARA